MCQHCYCFVTSNFNNKCSYCGLYLVFQQDWIAFFSCYASPLPNKTATAIHQIKECCSKTPVPLHRKRRNLLDSPRGLSVRRKASISDLKTVAAWLESDLAEVKTELSNVKATHDLCASKFGFLEDKITQLDNDYKVQIKLLSSRMIDVETTNEHLQSENTKLKTEMQNLKKNLKALDKKIETIENEKKHSVEEKNLQTIIPNHWTKNILALLPP